ncbi:MAG: hypothetical protein QXF15_01880 [Candidatus Aenigmatarchaeota archaeon]|nr:hypothetical protein [Candidatus Aenigmarchaeota archaeon]
MKSQVEPIVFILLLLIVLILILTAMLWGRDIIQNNIDAGRLSRAEQFIVNLDNLIQNIAQNGGSEKIEYPLDADIYITDECTGITPLELDKCIQIEQKNSLSLQEKWTYINTENPNKYGSFNDSISIIREKKEGDKVIIQLYYRIRGDYNYTIELEKMSYSFKPSYILIESGGTEVQKIIQGNYIISKIKLSFI